MRINHNIASLNTYRQLSTNSTNGQKSLEKLSSGLRINRAGDDAAGLAISEKMRGQIRGLDQASRNAQDGISMIQTAEGALSETHSILQRMKELATQSSNGTNTESDRAEIQKEINQLTSEINRIGNTTEFNTQKLLNGGGVDATTTAKVSGNGLVVPEALSTGTGITDDLNTASNRATSTVKITTIANDAAAIDAADGKKMQITIGDRTIDVVLDKTIAHTASTIDGNTIKLGISGGTTDAQFGAALANQLTSIINNDASLKGSYTAVNATDTVTIQAAAVSLSEDGVLQGSTLGGNVSVGKDATDGIATDTLTNAGSKGSHASATIDFSNVTVADLKGSEIIIDGKRVAFYDSADGKYEGDADFAVDLNGARTGEKIVDKIVDAFSGVNGTDVEASTAGTKPTFGSSHSAFTNVLLSKTEGTKLQVTALQSGAAGNLIEMGNNASVTVSQTYGNDRLTDESVVSAKGLSDGEHKVSIEYKASTATVAQLGASQAAGDVSAISVADTSTLESGTYRITFSVADTSVKIQKQGANGSWTDEGSTSVVTTADGAQTLDFGNGLKITTDAAFAKADYTDAADFTEFTIDAKHFEATLTEAGSDDTAGTAVRINNGEMNVELTAEDNIGSAVVNIGGWDADNFDVGESISWSFETKAAGTSSTEVSSGTFTAKLQIGANQGQSFQMDISDMRAQALNVSGTTAGTEAGNVEGAKFTAVKNVTNGTDNESAEFALDVSTHESATAAIKVLDNAIQSVSAQRSQLGAYQNRLEHTINNLGTSSENLTAAESRVRDVDMAKEMMEFTKNNILSQAAQAMMAQANQQPQGVLQLLR